MTRTGSSCQFPIGVSEWLVRPRSVCSTIAVVTCQVTWTLNFWGELAWYYNLSYLRYLPFCFFLLQPLYNLAMNSMKRKPHLGTSNSSCCEQKREKKIFLSPSPWLDSFPPVAYDYCIAPFDTGDGLNSHLRSTQVMKDVASWEVAVKTWSIAPLWNSVESTKRMSDWHSGWIRWSLATS